MGVRSSCARLLERSQKLHAVCSKEGAPSGSSSFLNGLSGVRSAGACCGHCSDSIATLQILVDALKACRRPVVLLN